MAADLNGDGWTDIYIACDSTPSIFFRNNRNGTFTDIAAEAGVAFSEHGFEQGGMGVGVGDFDNDGWLDLIKTNFAGDYPNVYRNTGNGIFEDVVVRAGLASTRNTSVGESRLPTWTMMASRTFFKSTGTCIQSSTPRLAQPRNLTVIPAWSIATSVTAASKMSAPRRGRRLLSEVKPRSGVR